MAKYNGISKKVMRDGSAAIFVRFKYLNTTYPVKNFTKLFGCNTEKQAYDKLNEVKLLISQGKNPFVNTAVTFDQLFAKRAEEQVRNGEWREITKDSYMLYYNKHIKKTIGHKKIEKITIDDFDEITTNMSQYEASTKNILKKLLHPIFKKAVIDRVISYNIANDLKRYKSNSDKNIDKRTSEDPLRILVKIYNAIPDYQVHCKAQEQEIKMYLYFVLLTSRRVSEVLKLKKEDVVLEEMRIISSSSITKTNIEDHFPLPAECLNYIENVEDGLLFPTLKRSSLHAIFKRLLNLTDIKFYKVKSLSLHDTRRLLMSVMISNLKIDSTLADTCISHALKGTKKYYLSFSYKDREEAFEKYWNLIREEAKFVSMLDT